MKHLILGITLLLSMPSFAGIIEDIRHNQMLSEQNRRELEQDRIDFAEALKKDQMEPTLRQAIDKIQNKYPELSDEEVLQMFLEMDAVN